MAIQIIISEYKYYYKINLSIGQLYQFKNEVLGLERLIYQERKELIFKEHQLYTRHHLHSSSCEVCFIVPILQMLRGQKTCQDHTTSHDGGRMKIYFSCTVWGLFYSCQQTLKVDQLRQWENKRLKTNTPNITKVFSD